ncbi:MAG: L-lactate dehydrogenase [Clostridia bacterium]|nr:L-lactate dehydrogenase [Clostridia bacterium]
MIEKRKVVLVGTGFVGMSMAYALLNQGGINELILIDVAKEKAIGEAMDLSDGVPCSPNRMVIRAGDYSDCKDANIVVITAGVAQKPGETRLELLKTNGNIAKEITQNVVKSGFDGIFVVASNPVDILSYIVQKTSGFPSSRVIGSGTVLDTARLRYLLGEYLQVSSKNIHTYIMGEHGDSSFVPWSKAYVGCKPLVKILEEKKKPNSLLEEFSKQVRDEAYEIIERKKSTYYGIGVALAKIIKAILNNEHEILTVSTMLNGEYGKTDIYMGVPAIITNKGVQEILQLELTKEEQQKFDNSYKVLNEMKIEYHFESIE